MKHVLRSVTKTFAGTLLCGKTKKYPTLCVSCINTKPEFDQIALPAYPRMGQHYTSVM